MSDEKNQPENPAPQTEIEFMGRKYDVAKPDGRAAYDAARFTFEKMYGDKARSEGELRKEFEPFRKYNLKTPSRDDVQIAEEVKKLREAGEEDRAFALLFEYNTQTRDSLRAEMQSEREFEQLWADYKTSRPEIFETFSGPDERVYKSYIKAEYIDKLGEADNQFEILDRVLSPKAARKRLETDVPALLDKAKKTAPAPAKEAEPESSPDKVREVWAKRLDELGFTSDR